MQLSLIAIASILATLANAALPVPASKGSVTYSTPKRIPANTVFDGLTKTYGRGVSCTGDAEVGDMSWSKIDSDLIRTF